MNLFKFPKRKQEKQEQAEREKRLQELDKKMWNITEVALRALYDRANKRATQ